MKTVQTIGEFALIGRLRRRISQKNRSLLVGIGDDCAVLRADSPKKFWLYTIDPVIEGVHFTRSAAPRAIGWKAMARNLSDIAAMGGVPRWVIVSLGLPPKTPVAFVEKLYDGIRAAAKKFGASIVGGDVAQSPTLFVAVALIGEVEKSQLVLRKGAQIGDSVFVTGALGGSIRGKHLSFTPRIREARWLTEHFKIHAMIDVSDGLAGDLRRLCEQNPRVGFEICAAEVPISRAARGKLSAALHDGEDFELLFCVSPRDVTGLREKWARVFGKSGPKLTEIGRVTASRGKIHVIFADGTRKILREKGYEHFR
jgi:thiamine-monophosphate kinase